jgi:hypothetical protein
MITLVHRGERAWAASKFEFCITSKMFCGAGPVFLSSKVRNGRTSDPERALECGGSVKFRGLSVDIFCYNGDMNFLYLFPCVFLFLFRCSVASSDYHEQLSLQPLPPASLLASFNFRSNASLSSFEQQHFRFIPRSLGQILQHAHAKELHLRFSTGRWDAESWGARPWGGAKEGGTGVELWAWVEAETTEE